MNEGMQIFVNIVVPVVSGLIFLVLAGYCAYIAPMRALVTGNITYQAAFWGFVCFGTYLATRPLQMLLGPHPMPLIVNNIREFLMIGVFGPGVFVAEISLAYRGQKIPKKAITIGAFGLGLVLATVFMITNIFAIGGSEEVYRIGNYIAYDGLWFKNLTPERSQLMAILFVCRELDPVILLLVVGIITLVRGITYPESERKMYDNMPKKLVFAGIGTICFSLSMQTVGLMWIFGKIPNQWWLYYLGALAAGVFETISISLPLKKQVEIK